MLHSSLGASPSTTIGRVKHVRGRRRTSLSTAAKLPSRGYFSEADPNAEVYSKAAKKFDPRKKPGRWDPEFIWQSNWQEALELEEQTRKAQEEAASVETPQPTGFLSLSRVADINTLDTDLRTEIKGNNRSSIPKIELPNMTSQRTYAKPTQAETRIWKRSNRLSERAYALDPTSEELQAVKEEELAAERIRYEQLKSEFQTWNLSLAAFAFVITYAFYTQDIALSYLIGAVGGFVYLRLLNKQVDGIGGGDLRSAVGPPRLLIPVILVLTYSRWNELAVDQTGIQLDLIPMLLGFFTYKGAVIARQGLQLLNDITEQNEAGIRGDATQLREGGNAQQGAQKAAPSIDDVMVKNILSR